MKKIRFLLIVFAGLAFIIGSSEDVVTGIFINPPVKGLQYSTPTQSGITNEKGEFQYIIGEKITFKIDNLEIATIEGNHQILINFLENFSVINQLLQSIDISNKKDLIDITGVKIPDDIKEKLQIIFNDNTVFKVIILFTQNELDAIENISNVVFVNEIPITTEFALLNLMNSTPIDDFNKSTIVSYSIDFDGNREFSLSSFRNKGTGYSFDSYFSGSVAPPDVDFSYAIKRNFTWYIKDNMLFSDSNATYNGMIIGTHILAIKQNTQYLLIYATTEKLILMVDNVYKSMPFDITDLNKKTINFSIETDDGSCQIKKLETIGSTGILKKHCSNQIFDIPVIVSNSEEFNDMVYINSLNKQKDDIFIKVSRIKRGKHYEELILILNPDKSTGSAMDIIRNTIN